MKKNTCLWLAFVIVLLLLSPATELRAETIPGFSEGDRTYDLVLLFCTVITAICLIGICLAAYLKKE